MPKDEPMTPEEFHVLRREFSTELARKLSHVRYKDRDDWFDCADQLGVDQNLITVPDVVIAMSGAALPSIGSSWAGLLLLDRAAPWGWAWFNEIHGAAPGPCPVVVREGSVEIATRLLNAAVKLLSSHAITDFKSVPEEGYDGSPTEIRIRCQGSELETGANASDDGREPALRLAKLLWHIFDSTSLTETQRYTPPADAFVSIPKRGF